MPFPRNVQVAVDPNPPADNVSAYNFYLDGSLASSGPSPSAVVSLPNAGSHVLGVSASNVWGESSQVQLQVIAAVPGVPTNIRVTVL